MGVTMEDQPQSLPFTAAEAGGVPTSVSTQKRLSRQSSSFLEEQQASLVLSSSSVVVNDSQEKVVTKAQHVDLEEGGSDEERALLLENVDLSCDKSDDDSNGGPDKNNSKRNGDDSPLGCHQNCHNFNQNISTIWDYVYILRDDIVSYLNLLRYNREFRLFLASYIFGHMGEWFTYIASISLMERLLGEENSNSRTSIGVLVMIRLLPTVLLSPFGGVLADSYDRRKSMIILDLVGACTPFIFILASLFEQSRFFSPTYGILMVYFATVCQECVCALYEPCRNSIVPLLVTGNDNDLKKATTLTGVAWSAVAAFGSALGGFATSYFGARTCFCIDSCCYLISALLMWWVGGNWKVAPDAQYESVWAQIKGMTVDGARYLSGSSFGGLVFFKASAALVVGATNVLNVSLSERIDDSDRIWFLGDMDTEQKLGILFSITGIGCILGPLVADPMTNIERPQALQVACIWGFVCVTVGCLGVFMFHPFWSVCLFSAVRSAGNGILWLDSQFLIQKFTAKEMLGRVSAVDDALATLSEALSSLLCGVLQDRANLSAERVSAIQAFLGLVFVGVWSMYHISGRGAACNQNTGKSPMKKSS